MLSKNQVSNLITFYNEKIDEIKKYGSDSEMDAFEYHSIVFSSASSVVPSSRRTTSWTSRSGRNFKKTSKKLFTFTRSCDILYLRERKHFPRTQGGN